jgi:hypothetical protein
VAHFLANRALVLGHVSHMVARETAQLGKQAFVQTFWREGAETLSAPTEAGHPGLIAGAAKQ